VLPVAAVVLGGGVLAVAAVDPVAVDEVAAVADVSVLVVLVVPVVAVAVAVVPVPESSDLLHPVIPTARTPATSRIIIFFICYSCRLRKSSRIWRQIYAYESYPSAAVRRQSGPKTY
jgi:hypothetical protein